MGRTDEQVPFDIEGREEKQRYRFNKSKFFGFFLAVLLIAGIAACTSFLLRGYTEIKGVSAAVPKPTKISHQAIITPDKSTAPAKRTAVIDAGHGGPDCGAIGVSGVHEDTLNLKVAKYLEKELEDSGFDVMMTREDENAIAPTKSEDMAKRRQIISGSQSDIVISIHMNSHTNLNTSGPIVFFMQGSAAGEAFADSVQSILNEKLAPKVQNSPHAEGDFFILKSGTQPSILVECGFLTNPEEEALLKKVDYQKKIAQAICEGAVKFLEMNGH